MLKNFSMLFFIMVKFVIGSPLNPNDPNYFPPYKCENQPSLKVNFLFFWRVRIKFWTKKFSKQLKKGTATKVPLWPNGVVFYEIAPAYTGKSKVNQNTLFC